MSSAVASEYGLFSSFSRGGNDSRPTCAHADALIYKLTLLVRMQCACTANDSHKKRMNHDTMQLS